MRRSLAAALVVIVAFGIMTAPVVQAGNVSIVSGPDDVEMDSDTATTVIEVENTGEESMEVDVEITQEPSGVDVTPEDGMVLEPGETTEVQLNIDADDTVDNENVQGEVDSEQFDFTVDRPPLAGFEDEPLDLGDVLVGESEEGDVTIEEVSGDGSLDGVSWSVVNDDSDAEFSFSDMNTVSGSEGTASWEIDVDNNVDQYETLSWTVEVADQRHVDKEYATREVDVEARVIYPGYFGDLDIEDELTFDEPRDENDELTRRLRLEVRNDGDQPLDIRSISADASNNDISVTVPDEPDSIDGTSTETVDLSVTADTSLSEGNYDIEADVRADDRDVDDASYSGEFEIVHGTELSADNIDFGDVPIGQAQTASTEVSEELGYNDLPDISVRHSTGPDDWLSTETTPSSIDANGSETVEFGLEFDTSADLGTEYEWDYTIYGDRDSERVTITATPIPLDLDPIRDDLSDYDGTVADNTLDIVNTMDEQIRDGQPNEDEVSAVLAFGDAATLYLSSIKEANDHIEDDDHEAAQQEIARAAIALNTMSLYSEGISGSEQYSASQQVIEKGEADVESLVDQQATYYEGQLDSGELTLLEEATINRQLSQIATLQGDTERGDELEAVSTEAFDSYVETVSNAEQDVQDANTVWSTMESEQFVTLLGQPLLFNPAEYDTFSERSAEMDASYERAIDSFDEAGATSRSEAVANEYDSRSLGTSIAAGSLFISTSLFGLLSITLIGRTARQMYWYVQDSRETVNGDFLL